MIHCLSYNRDKHCMILAIDMVCHKQAKQLQSYGIQEMQCSFVRLLGVSLPMSFSQRESTWGFKNPA